MSQSTVPPTEMDRDELEAEVENLRERVATIEQIFDIRAESPEDASIEDIWIAGHPLGMIAEKAKQRSKDALNSENNSAAVSEATRSEAIEIHRRLFDWKHGAASDLEGQQGASTRRAVRIFRQFIQFLRDDHDGLTLVEASNGRFKMGSKDARRVLEHNDDLNTSNPSTTIKRALWTLVDMSQHEECDCSLSHQATHYTCPHRLFRFSNEDEYILSADQEAFVEYIRSVQETVTGDRGADDAVSPETGPAEAAADGNGTGGTNR